MIISIFEDDALGNAEDELIALGLEFTERFVRYCYRIEDGDVDVRYSKTFADIGGVPIFHATIGERFVVYALESDRAERKIMVLVAGLHGVRARFGSVDWNGYDYDGLKRDVVLPRAAVIFE